MGAYILSYYTHISNCYIFDMLVDTFTDKRATTHASGLLANDNDTTSEFSI